MATHSSTLARKIPWMEEPARMHPWGHEESDTTEWLHFHFSLSCVGEGNGNPLQCSCLENPRDRGACWAAIYGVSQSRTRMKQLSSSSNYFKTLWWFLPYIHMNQPWVYMITHPDPPSNLPPHPITQSHPSAPALSTLSHASNLDWWSVSHMTICMFQCYPLKSSHPHLLPQSPKVFFTSVSLLLSYI